MTRPRRRPRPRRLRLWPTLTLLGIVIGVVLWMRQGPPPTLRWETGQVLHHLTGPVVQVVDGNTIDVQLDGRPIRVRYLGVSTPATKHPEKGLEPFGPEAVAANRRLVEGQTVRLELDVEPWDRDQRLLAYVYVEDVMINAELVRQGYAQVATVPPNVRYQDRFSALQQEAREAQRGLWAKP